jgi:hypothetical protein
MAQQASESIARQIESLFDGGSTAGLSDEQLLERFTARRDAAGDAAFAALVTRYGPMVLHVCRQLLGDRHDADYAFQAVFLVLARKARSIREPDLLGAWLHCVAIRTALGRITLPTLTPGAMYRVFDYSTFRGPDGAKVRKEFTVRPGETLDLGDILIEKPVG